MKKVYFLIVSALILGLLFISCGVLNNSGVIPTSEPSGMTYLTKVGPESTILYAGQNIEVGTVYVWNDEENLYVKYVITDSDWCLTETHIHVGEKLKDFPLAGHSGNPIPGQFDYSDPHDCVSDYEYVIPLKWEVDDELLIAAHAIVEKWVDDELIDEETAWGFGPRFTEQGNWATYFIYTVSTAPPTKPEWLGDPQYIPDIILTLQPTNVHFHILVNKKSDNLASESPVKLLKRDENNNWVLLDEIFDDGDLDNHGDEIKGDRIYSNIIEFYEENAKDILLKIVVTTSDNQQYSVEFNLSVIGDISEEIFQEINEVSTLAEQKLIEIMQSPPSNLAGVTQMLSDYLVEQTYIENCEIFDNILQITFDTGVLMEIRLINMDAGEPPEGGNLTVIQEDLKLSSNKNREEEYIPLPIESQTTGVDVFSDSLSKDTSYYLESKDVLGVEYIGNRDVFVYDPFYEFYTYYGYDVGSHYEQLLDNSGIDFNTPQVYRDDQADIEALKTMLDYGIVIIHTHGNKYFEGLVTGEEWNIISEIKYFWKMIIQEIFISNKIGVSWNGDVKVYGKRFGVTKKWLNSSNLPGEFPNSIIFNNSCYSNSGDFYDAFDSLGAATYYGHSCLSWNKESTTWTSEVLEGLIDGKTTGEAYVERSHDWEWEGETGTTYWQMEGKENVKIPVSIPFSNGGFEDGFMNWTKEGDGRIIYALSLLEPTEGTKMGIISTGLGYTDKYGSLSQTFDVGDDETKLQFDWNYISEEFLWYIGSIFQDPFKVTLTKVDDSSTTTLLHKTVDSIAAEFGATQVNGGDLIYVSPDIVFDKGDVWMTGWQNNEYDISAFQGKTVTITFEAEDLGDEIFDTAILLDDIKVY